MNAVDALKERLVDFFDDYLTEYVNPHEVTFQLFDDMSLYLTIGCPGYDYELDIDVSFTCSCKSMDEFFELFQIKEFIDLGRIKMVDFQNLYIRGKAQIICTVGDHDLYFRKMGETMEVLDDRDHIHVLNRLLTKADEFTSYTNDYYQNKEAI